MKTGQENNLIEQRAENKAVQIGIIQGGTVKIDARSMDTTNEFQPRVFRIKSSPMSFVNREGERTMIISALRQGGIIQISGMAGVGKSALVAKIIEELDESEFPDGILWLSLKAGLNVEGLCSWIVEAYGFKIGKDALGAVRGILYDKKMLIILDDAENAPGILTPICESRGKATILIITKDRTVGSTNTKIINEVRPLNRESSIELLSSKLEHHTEEMETIKEICELVGDLPLALVLVAGYVRGYDISLQEYMQEFKESPLQLLHIADHQQESIIVALQLSWERLDKDSQRALQVIASIPAETISTDAVAAGMSATISIAKRSLRTLRRFSMISVEEERWGTHPLIRTYVQHTMNDEDKRGIHQALKNYFGEYIQKHGSKIGFLNYQVLFDEAALHVEYENLIGTMEWAYHDKEWLIVIEYADIMDAYLSLRGFFKVRQEVIRWWIEASNQTQQMNDLVKALNAKGSLHSVLGEHELAQRSFNEALPLARSVEDKISEAVAIYGIGITLFTFNKSSEALEHYQAALHIFQECQNVAGEAMVNRRLGYTYERLSNYRQAQEKFTRARQLFQKSNIGIGEADALMFSAKIHNMLGEYSDAKSKLEEALQIVWKYHSKIETARILQNLGILHYFQRDFEQSQRYLQMALKISQEGGYRVDEALTTIYIAKIQYQKKQYNTARKLLDRALTIYHAVKSHNGRGFANMELGNIHRSLEEFLDAEEKYDIALSMFRQTKSRYQEAQVLDNIGQLYMLQKNHENAIKYFNEAATIFESIGNHYFFNEIHCRKEQAEKVIQNKT